VRALPELADRVPDVVLVLAGPDGHAREAVDAAVTALPAELRDRVLMAGPVSEPARVALLQSALALAYPSLYEGFGFPVLEAMSLGTPVVSSDLPVLAEVGGDAALRAAVGDPSAFADALARLAEDASLRDAQVSAGRARAAGYSWERTGTGLLAAYSRRPAPRRSRRTAKRPRSPRSGSRWPGPADELLRPVGVVQHPEHPARMEATSCGSTRTAAPPGHLGHRVAVAGDDGPPGGLCLDDRQPKPSCSEGNRSKSHSGADAPAVVVRAGMVRPTGVRRRRAGHAAGRRPADQDDAHGQPAQGLRRPGQVLVGQVPSSRTTGGPVRSPRGAFTKPGRSGFGTTRTPGSWPSVATSARRLPSLGTVTTAERAIGSRSHSQM
jgi:hypothetical protein